jgi:hypothetical protein
LSSGDYIVNDLDAANNPLFRGGNPEGISYGYNCLPYVGVPGGTALSNASNRPHITQIEAPAETLVIFDGKYNYRLFSQSETDVRGTFPHSRTSSGFDYWGGDVLIPVICKNAIWKA